MSHTKEVTIYMYIPKFSLEMLSTIQLSKECLDIILCVQLFTRLHGDIHIHFQDPVNLQSPSHKT